MSINEDNETFENNVMNIRFNYNVVRNVAVTVKTKNWKLRDAAWAQNFRNKQIEEDAFDENTEISIERNITRAVNDRNQLFENIVVVDKIDDKRLNWLTEIRLKFNEIIKNVDNAVFAAAKEISTDEKWNRIEKENFETFNHFYNSKNVQITSLTLRDRSFAILISINSSRLLIDHVEENDELNTHSIILNFSIFRSTNNHSFNIFFSSSAIFFYLNHTQL